MHIPNDVTIGQQFHDAILAAGLAKSEMVKTKKIYQNVLARVTLDMRGDSVAERKILAEAHPKTEEARERMYEKEAIYIQKRAEADAIGVLFEEWRSQNATARAEMQCV